MTTLSRNEILDLIWEEPYLIGKWVGFKDLTELHNEWLKMFLYSEHDLTLQGHRGSYKTTALSVFLAIHSVIQPNESVILFRKSGGDVVEIMYQTANILRSGCFNEIVKVLYHKELKLIKASSSEIQTNLATTIKGRSQISGLGTQTSITGKHSDIVITDDIINVTDRASQAERERTKRVYMELQNIKNRGGRIINTGTPWHKEDAFTLMPEPLKYDCYSTGLMTDEQIADLKLHMSPSLFSANYELKHIASEDILFANAQTGASPETVLNGIAHVDSAFYGDDYTAFTIMAYHEGKYYIYGKMWRKHVEDCYQEITDLYNHFMCGKIYLERNADKGMVARDLKNIGLRSVSYDESTNKHIKISTYLKAIWADSVFVEGTDSQYIEQIVDYTENAEHDDAPDSASCLARLFYKKYSKRERSKLIIPNEIN